MCFIIITSNGNASVEPGSKIVTWSRPNGTTAVFVIGSTRGDQWPSRLHSEVTSVADCRSHLFLVLVEREQTRLSFVSTRICSQKAVSKSIKSSMQWRHMPPSEGELGNVSKLACWGWLPRRKTRLLLPRKGKVACNRNRTHQNTTNTFNKHVLYIHVWSGEIP